MAATGIGMQDAWETPSPFSGEVSGLSAVEINTFSGLYDCGNGNQEVDWYCSNICAVSYCQLLVEVYKLLTLRPPVSRTKGGQPVSECDRR